MRTACNRALRASLLVLAAEAVSGFIYPYTRLLPSLRRMMAVGLVSSHGLKASKLEALDDIASAIRADPWRGGLEPAEDYELTKIPSIQIEGTLPVELEGTFYRNGPGRIRIGDETYGHWFDGDGMVTALTIRGGECYYRQRYMRGEKFLAQAAHGRQSIGPRGVWTQVPGSWLSNLMRFPGNPINTNVVMFAGKVYALCEGGPPMEIDPVTLDIKAPNTFGGVLTSFFSAHPKTDPDTGILYNIGLKFGITMSLTIMKVDTNGTILQQTSTSLGELVQVHDFALAGDFIVVFVSPYMASFKEFGRALLGLQPLGAAYAWHHDRPTRVLIFRKLDLSLACELEVTPPVSFYHFINAWQRPGEDVVEVLVARHRGDREELERMFGKMYQAHFTQNLECEAWRFVFDVSRGEVMEAGLMPNADSTPGFELPAVNPHYVGKASAYAYLNTLARDEGFIHAVSKMYLNESGRIETHDFGKGRFASEAVFVPRARPEGQECREDDGFLLHVVYDSTTDSSDLVILDAKRVGESPPLCTIHLPVRAPFTFHGIWTPETFGVGEQFCSAPATP